MDIIWITCLLVISLELTLSLPTDGSLPLLHQLQSVANRIQQTQPDSSSGVNSIQQMQVDSPVKDQSLYEARLKAWNAQWDPVPPSPGLTNVCETFCPKFCRKEPLDRQKGKGPDIRRRGCHFACTNLCDRKVGSDWRSHKHQI